MSDLRYLVPNISALTKALDSDYSHIHGVLKGAISPSSKLAKRIEAETKGAIRAVWLLGLEVPPAQSPASPEVGHDNAA